MTPSPCIAVLTLTPAQRRANPVIAAALDCLRDPEPGEECVEMYPEKTAGSKRVSAASPEHNQQSPEI